MQGFIFGFAAGVAITIPLIIIASRRTARRVRALETRRRGTERLAELGRLTSGLAHEIKNPLSTLGLNMQLIQEDLDAIARSGPPGSPVPEALARVQRRFVSLSREAQRLRQILEDFLRFAGRVRLDRASTNIRAMIEEMMDFFAPQAQAAGVQFRSQFDPQPIVLDVDAALLKQALLNLLINAVQAMTDARGSSKPHGGCGELIVRTECRGDEALIHVIDTGPGIDPASSDIEGDINRIFEPYFTTKKSGTGLGLPTARRLVEEHGGTLTYHSEPGRGTDFIVSLPLETP